MTEDFTGREKMSQYAEDAKRLHREGNRCSASVYKAFENINTFGDGQIPAPRSEDGKCGAVLTAEKLIREMKLGDPSDFDAEFERRYGSLKCGELLKKYGRRCNEFVGVAAEYIERMLSQKATSVPERVTALRNAWAANDAERDAGLTEPDDVEKYKDISYGPYDRWNLLDVYRPLAQAGNRLPVIVNVHGGGYFYGDKELYRFYCMHLAQFGFSVINFNYRLSPENKFPAPLEDTMAVFKWISENYEEYGLDRSRVFMTGDSAGAQLASQFACICTNGAYASLFGFEIPSDIKLLGISLACGMYDIRRRTKESEEMMMDYFGDLDPMNDPRTEILANITSEYPPAYVFSASNDMLVDECVPFAEYLKNKGIGAESFIYGDPEDKSAAHVFHLNLRLPLGEEANRAQTAFFKKLL